MANASAQNLRTTHTFTYLYPVGVPRTLFYPEKRTIIYGTWLIPKTYFLQSPCRTELPQRREAILGSPHVLVRLAASIAFGTYE
jgi:hypothetical protein